jgi:hypothetical protein
MVSCSGGSRATLRLDGPEHVLCFAPTGSGKGKAVACEKQAKNATDQTTVSPCASVPQSTADGLRDRAAAEIA